ncbi:hypothetical protein FRB99_004136 [Tulasnella sp. 403]|nr:hypothetical protein FRB99_004136 [Tulasnella sp. 403]
MILFSFSMLLVSVTIFPLLAPIFFVLAVASFLLLFPFLFCSFVEMAAREPGLPPGPPTIPLLGNLHQLPKYSSAFCQLDRWAKKYGEIYSIKLASRTAVVLSSPGAVREVLVRRAAITADRPPNALVTMISGEGHATYSRQKDLGRCFHKSMTRVLSSEACEKRAALHIAEASQLSFEMIRDSENFSANVLRYSSSVVVPFGGALFEAGVEPVASFLHHFVALLALHPEVLQRCHQEMDQEIGINRSPMPEDMETLRYLRAVIKEVMRFRPLKPFAIPHASTEDQIFRGYLIPHDSAIFVNVWGILHDPNIFDQPELFNPDRYILSPLGIRQCLDESEYAILDGLEFGFGYRACPGRRLGQTAIELAAAKLLWGFTFSIAVDGQGKRGGFDYNALPKGPTLTLPFDCTIQPRSAAHADVIEAEYKNAMSTLGNYNHESSQPCGDYTKFKLD